jgi:hypothetical protein
MLILIRDHLIYGFQAQNVEIHVVRESVVSYLIEHTNI